MNDNPRGPKITLKKHKMKTSCWAAVLLILITFPSVLNVDTGEYSFHSIIVTIYVALLDVVCLDVIWAIFAVVPMINDYVCSVRSTLKSAHSISKYRQKILSMIIFYSHALNSRDCRSIEGSLDRSGHVMH